MKRKCEYEQMVFYTGVGSSSDDNMFTIHEFTIIMHKHFPETKKMNLLELIRFSGAVLR